MRHLHLCVVGCALALTGCAPTPSGESSRLSRWLHELTSSPELALAAPRWESPNGAKTTPAIAFDGANYLVVWMDAREDLGTDIYGARVTPAGTMLELVSIPVSNVLGSQGGPRVVFGGSQYFVVWVDDRSGATQLYGARVSTTGNVLDPAGILLEASVDFDTTVALAFSSGSHFLAWEAAGNGKDIKGARFDTSGVKQGSTFTISGAANAQRLAQLAPRSSGVFAVWQDHRGADADIYGARVDATGTVLDPGGLPIATAAGRQESPCVSTDGSGYLVAWETYVGSTSSIQATRLDAVGTPLDVPALAVASGAQGMDSPAQLFDGTNHWVAWTDRSTYSVGGTRISTGGAILDSPRLDLASSFGFLNLRPALASSPTEIFVVFDQGFASVIARRWSRAPALLDAADRLLSWGSSGQDLPAATFTGANYLVAWQEGDLRGTLVTPPGGVAADAGVVLVSRGNNGVWEPVLASNGQGALMAFVDGRTGIWSLHGVRLDGAGTPLDNPSLDLTDTVTPKTSPALATGGGAYFVAWEDQGGSTTDLLGTVVFTDGGVAFPSGVPIVRTSGEQTRPDVAFDGQRFVVVWEDDQNTLFLDVFGAWLELDGGRATPVRGVPISTAIGHQSRPRVSAQNGTAYVVWQDEGSGNIELHGTRWTFGSSPEPERAIVTQPGDQRAPTLVDDGVNLYLAWEDTRAGERPDIYGTPLDRSLAPLFDGGVALSADSTSEFAPALVAGPTGSLLLAYHRFDDAPSMRSLRAKARLVFTGVLPDGGFADAGADGGGSLVDGGADGGSSPPDGGADGGFADAGEDGGSPGGDGGPSMDAGADGGSTDAGVDGGSPGADAGSADAGSSPALEPRVLRVDCGCSTGEALFPGALILGLGLVSRRRRRRSRP